MNWSFQICCFTFLSISCGSFCIENFLETKLSEANLSLYHAPLAGGVMSCVWSIVGVCDLVYVSTSDICERVDSSARTLVTGSFVHLHQRENNTVEISGKKNRTLLYVST